jgi:bacteriocin biosynthesis cyclodehydratase domain-containing protein
VVAEVDELRAAGCPVDVRRESALGRTPAWADLRGYDVVVVTPGRGRTGNLLALVEAGVPAGVSLLPVWQLGGKAVIGPFMNTDTTGCWVCAALRLGGNAEPADAAGFWSRAAGFESAELGTAVPEPRGPLAAMAGNLLAYEIFRITTGCLPPETVGKVIVQDVDSLDVSAEPLRPHPACRHCSPVPTRPDAVPDFAAGLAQPSASAIPGRALPEPGSPESAQQLAALTERTALIGPHAGIFRGFDDDLLTQSPLRVSTVEVAVAQGRRRRVAAFDLHTVAGARLAALAAAAAVYAEHVVPPAVVDTDAAELTADRARPGTLATASGLGAQGPEAWVDATSLTTGERILVPAAAVAPHSRHNDGRTFVPGSAGVGVDGTPEQARGAALLSALGHDALRAALHGEIRVLRIQEPWHGTDPVLTFLARTAANLNVGIDLLELGPADEQPAPVLLARGTTPDGVVLWAAAADTSWRAAAVMALRDVLGQAQLGDTLPGGDPVDSGNAWITDLAPQRLAVGGEVAPRHDLMRTFAEMLDRACAAGVEPVVADLPTPDLAAGGLSVARVLIRRYTDGQ